MIHLITIVSISLLAARASPDFTTLITVRVPEYGRVQGSLHNVPVYDRSSDRRSIALAMFLGVPYAEPPLGALRFVAPRPLPPDADGQRLVRALHFPPACSQRLDRAFDGIRGECLQASEVKQAQRARIVASALGIRRWLSERVKGRKHVTSSCVRSIGIDMWNPRARLDEDCLYLSIWSPATDALHVNNTPSSTCARPLAGLRAVLVWVHGGGYETGASSSDMYEGSALAAAGDVLVLSVQYRLGALGFLYLGVASALCASCEFMSLNLRHLQRGNE